MYDLGHLLKRYFFLFFVSFFVFGLYFPFRVTSLFSYLIKENNGSWLFPFNRGSIFIEGMRTESVHELYHRPQTNNASVGIYTGIELLDRATDSVMSESFRLKRVSDKPEEIPKELQVATHSTEAPKTIIPKYSEVKRPIRPVSRRSRRRFQFQQDVDPASMELKRKSIMRRYNYSEEATYGSKLFTTVARSHILNQSKRGVCEKDFCRKFVGGVEEPYDYSTDCITSFLVINREVLS